MQVGKRVRGSLYVHRSACHALPTADRERIAAATRTTGAEWNVVRLGPTELTLLMYAEFDSDPFPRLDAAVRVVEGGEAIRTDYSRRKNPPILHRKELLVATDHPRRDGWCEVTRRLVSAGAFVEPHRIGTRDTWLRRLQDLGLTSEWKFAP